MYFNYGRITTSKERIYMKVKPVKKMRELMTQQISTPVGIAKFPRLKEPDTQFDPDGVFSIKILFNEDDGAAVQEAIESFYEKSLTHAENIVGKKLSGQDIPVAMDTDADGNETGLISIRAKSKAKIVKAITVFDQYGDRTEEMVTPGSKIKLAATLASYNVGGKFGVSIRLNAVLLLEAGESRNAPNDLFEDDFVKKPAAAATTDSDESIF